MIIYCPLKCTLASSSAPLCFSAPIFPDFTLSLLSLFLSLPAFFPNSVTDVGVSWVRYSLGRECGGHQYLLLSFSWMNRKAGLVGLSTILSAHFGGNHQEDVTTPVDLWAGSGQPEAPQGLPCLRNVVLFPQLEPFQGQNLAKVKCYWDHLDGIRDWILLKPHTLLSFRRTGWKSYYSSCGARDKPGKFPCLLKLSPTGLEWSAFFFCVFLISMYGDQFVYQQLREVKPSRFWNVVILGGIWCILAALFPWGQRKWARLPASGVAFLPHSQRYEMKMEQQLPREGFVVSSSWI